MICLFGLTGMVQTAVDHLKFSTLAQREFCAVDLLSLVALDYS